MKKTILAIFLTCGSLSSLAQDSDSIGASFGIGDPDYVSLSEDIDTLTNLSFYYRAKLWKDVDLKFAYHTGTSESLVQIDDDGNPLPASVEDEELNYSALAISANWNILATSNNEVFAGIGINYHDVEVKIDEVVHIEESGVGHYLELGWRYHFSDSFSATLAIQKIDMDKIDANTTNFGFEFRF